MGVGRFSLLIKIIVCTEERGREAGGKKEDGGKGEGGVQVSKVGGGCWASEVGGKGGWRVWVRIDSYEEARGWPSSVHA
jgi:hypothetical protein